MSVTLQLLLLHLTDKLSLDESFMLRRRLLIVLLLELNDIAVMLLGEKSM